MTSFKVTDIQRSIATVPLLRFPSDTHVHHKTQEFGVNTDRLPIHRIIDPTTAASNGVDQRFLVQAMTISQDTFFLKRWVLQIHAWCWYVQVGLDGKTAIFVKVNSLAKRLFLDKAEIYAAAKKRALPALIAEQRKMIDAWVELHNSPNLKEILACGETQIGRTFGPEKQKRLGLIKAICKAKKIAETNYTEKNQKRLGLLNISEDHFGKGATPQKKSDDAAKKEVEAKEKFVFGDTCEEITVKEEGLQFRFRAFYTRNGVHLIRDERDIKPMSETFPHVYKVYNFMKNECCIFKTNKPTANRRKVDVQLEATILNEINGKKDKKHVQLPPIATINTRYMKGALHSFLEGGDLLTYMAREEIKPAEIKAVFNEILEALEEFVSLERHHGDLKPHNILMDKKGGDLKFIDWEGSSAYDTGNAPDAYTEGYFCKNDFIAIKNFAAFNPADKKGLNELLAKMDVYAFGVILYQLVAADLPTFILETDTIKVAARGKEPKMLDRTPLKADVPENVINFLEKMLHPDIAQRYSVAQAIEAGAALTWLSFKAPAQPPKGAPTTAAAATSS